METGSSVLSSLLPLCTAHTVSEALNTLGNEEAQEVASLTHKGKKTG